MLNDILDTVQFVRRAHRGQTDKAGKPYHEHVERVAMRVGLKLAKLSAVWLVEPALHDAILRAALLHDVVEDTPHTFDDLRAMGYGDETVEMVRLVTRDKRDGLTYQQWVEQIAESGNVGAILIKLADNEDNSDPARIAQLPEGEQGVRDRYERSKKRLREALRGMGLGDGELNE